KDAHLRQYSLRRVQATAPLKPRRAAEESREEHGALRRVQATAPLKLELEFVNWPAFWALRRVQATAPLKRLGVEVLGLERVPLRRVQATAPLKRPRASRPATTPEALSVAFRRRLH